MQTNNDDILRLRALFLCIPTCLGTTTSAPTSESTTTSLSESTTTSEPTCVDTLFACLQLCGAARTCAGKCYDNSGVTRDDFLECKRNVPAATDDAANNAKCPNVFEFVTPTGDSYTQLCNVECACRKSSSYSR